MISKPLCLSLLLIAAVAAAPAKRKITGIVTDSMCADADHSHMQMGPTDGECVIACVSIHNAAYVLYDGKQAWTLSDQKTPERFAGKKVTVTGTLDAKNKTIQVDSIVPAN